MKKFGSWKTSTAGIGAILAAFGMALKAQFDSDPLTVPDWSLVITAIVGGIGLIMARDNNVTSEQAGAK